MEVIVGKIEGQIENMSQQLSRIEKLLMARLDSSHG